MLECRGKVQVVLLLVFVLALRRAVKERAERVGIGTAIGKEERIIAVWDEDDDEYV